CPSCQRTLRTGKGLRLHLVFSTRCQGYRRNKLKELKLDCHHISEDKEVIVDDAQTLKELVPPNQDREVSPGVVVEDFHDRLFDFIPQDTSTRVQDLEIQEDVEEDTRVEEDIYPAAARILCTNETLHERWNEVFGSEGSDEKFAPFRSEMDWRFVEWTIKSGMGHKQLDHLLGIPGLVDNVRLSYSNTRSLHRFIEEVPPHAKWKSHRLSFRDTPEEKDVLHYRSPLEAIKALLGDPALAEHIVYKPKRIFTNASKEKRVYNEMWTGRW
ncbi:hypothetical protein SCLCIDRAFT_93723, partial [Scleroderma citrinum Foug A]